MGHIDVTPEADAIGKFLVELQLQLVTTGTNLTLIDSRSCSTKVRWDGAVITKDQNVVTTVAEEIERTGNQTTQETIVDTEVGLLHSLPLHIFITQCILAIPCVDTVGMVKIHHCVTSVCPLVHVEPTTRRVEWIAQVIITNLTVRCTELQHINDVLVTKILHEVFLSDGPTDSSRIEEGEAIVLAKLF